MFVVVRQQTWDTMFMSTLKDKTFRASTREFRILEEISAGDMFVGFLSSAKSTRLAYRIAKKRAHDRYVNKKLLERLERRGYVKRIKEGADVKFFITEKGKQSLRAAYQQTTEAIKHPERWDGLWRVIIYDFPENERSLRNSLRYVLTKSNFLKIQKSVWIFPYDAPLLSSLLENEPMISACIVFMKTKSISSESSYKKHFQLK